MIVREVFTAVAIITLGVLLWNQMKEVNCWYTGDISESQQMSVSASCVAPPDWWSKLGEDKRQVSKDVPPQS